MTRKLNVDIVSLAGQGGIRSTAQQQLPTAASKQKSHNLHVYQDENMKTQPQQLPRLPMRHFPDSSHTKENTQKPSKWPKAKVLMSTSSQ